MDDGVLGPHGQLAALSVSITERDTATTLRLKTVEVTASATIWMGEIAQGAGAEVRDKEKVSIILFLLINLAVWCLSSWRIFILNDWYMLQKKLLEICVASLVVPYNS